MHLQLNLKVSCQPQLKTQSKCLFNALIPEVTPGLLRIGSDIDRCILGRVLIISSTTPSTYWKRGLLSLSYWMQSITSFRS